MLVDMLDGRGDGHGVLLLGGHGVFPAEHDQHGKHQRADAGFIPGLLPRRFLQDGFQDGAKLGMLPGTQKHVVVVQKGLQHRVVRDGLHGQQRTHQLLHVHEDVAPAAGRSGSGTGGVGHIPGDDTGVSGLEGAASVVKFHVPRISVAQADLQAVVKVKHARGYVGNAPLLARQHKDGKVRRQVVGAVFHDHAWMARHDDQPHFFRSDG